MKIFRLPRHTSNRILLFSAGGALLAASFLFGAVSSGVTDIDQDTYVGVQFGGNDCHDSLQAAFKTNGTACDPNISPTFLESKADADSDDDIADHAWMRDETGLAHLYFQNEDQGAGDFLEHYTSNDFASLTYVGPALTQTPGGWDRYGLWAPSVVKNPSDGLYYMFYAGTTAGGGAPSAQQRIGVATSSDLSSWTKAPINNCSGTTGDGCVYECDETWTLWGNGGSYYDQCRDPFVIWDSAQSRWLLFATTQLNNGAIGGPWTQGITVATSTDLLHWTGLGYIKASKRQWASEGGVGAQLTGGIAENPFVTEYDGAYYLFFTDYNDPEDYWNVPNPRTIVQYASTSDLTAAPDGSLNWTYRGSTRDPGVNAAEIQKLTDDVWLVSHSIVPNPYSGYWGSHSRDLRLKRMIWNDDGTFTTSNLINLDCRVPSAVIHPDVSEQCNDGLDNDCNNAIDDPDLCGVCVDGDGDGYGTSGTLQCAHPEIDCNDANYFVHPGAPEYCYDEIDNNCNGETDEAGCTPICIDNDEDLHGREGFDLCAYPEPDCNDDNFFINPLVAETCSDGVDNNCNGQIDDPAICDPCVDADLDGFGVSGFAQCTNAQPDCNDGSPTVYPGATERCDRIDNNCNSFIDEGGVCRSRKIRWTVCDAGDEGDGIMSRACFVYY